MLPKKANQPTQENAMNEIHEVQARLIALQFFDYKNYAAGKGIPLEQPFYEATFQLIDSDETILFPLSPLEGSVLELEETGTLKYQINKYRNTLLRFADKIQEVNE